MWQSIEDEIKTATGDSFKILTTDLVLGGDINQAYKISDGCSQYFVKINDADHMSHFEAEAYALKQIKSAQQISCPDVIAQGKTHEHSYLVLNYIPLSPGNEKNWYQLGQKLALLHKNVQHGKYGWQSDNYIGDTLQPNAWSKNWRTFFAEQRIGWQLQLLHEKSIKLGDVDHITSVCHDALGHHATEPCLVHGDLWHGNLGFTDSEAVIFDPACYYGDREVDIAMTELFGYLPQDFYQGYQDFYPIKSGFEQRKIIYNFYHVLNHANLFGGVYIEQAKALLSRVMTLSIH